ncbi:TPA: helix-turn-helix domain-containing protein [Enterobacter chengduensis]|nr:helix-turn-helix domain-containing protein [Enterobacter chengduensis]
MNYVLDDIISYCPEDGTIKFLGGSDQDMTILTPIPNRILQLLVKNQGKMLSRDTILVEVWDNYGKVGSTNSLKQNIGLLRKTLDPYLNTSTIVTMPSQGYMFNTQTKIIVIDEETSVTPDLLIKQKEVLTNIKKNSLFRILLSEKHLLILFTVLIVVGMTYLIYKTSTIYTSINAYELSNIDGCKIYSLKKYDTPLEKSEAQAEVKLILDRLKPQCSNQDRLFFYENFNKDGAEEKSKLLIQCGKSISKEIGCITYRTNR